MDFQSFSGKFHLFSPLRLKTLLASYSGRMRRPSWRVIAFELFFCTSTVGTNSSRGLSVGRAALEINAMWA